MLLAGLDIGSTGCKVAVYRDNGEFLGKTYRDYPVQRVNSEHEVDPAAIWQGVKEAVKEAADRWPGISGLGVTSFGETFVLLESGYSQITEKMFQEAGMRPKQQYTVKDDYTVMSMVESGLGVSLLPELMLRRGKKVETFRIADGNSLRGVNTPEDLAICDALLTAAR